MQELVRCHCARNGLITDDRDRNTYQYGVYSESESNSNKAYAKWLHRMERIKATRADVMACSGANGPDLSHLPRKHDLTSLMQQHVKRYLGERSGNMLTIYQQQRQTSRPQTDRLIVHPIVSRDFHW